MYWANKDRSDGIGCSRNVTLMDSMKFAEKSAMDGARYVKDNVTDSGESIKDDRRRIHSEPEAKEVSTIGCVERSADEEVNAVDMAEEVGVIFIDSGLRRSYHRF